MNILNRSPQSREIIFGGYALTLLALLAMGMVAFFQVRSMSRELANVSSPFWYQLAQRELLIDLTQAESSLRAYATIVDPATGRPDPKDLLPLRSGTSSYDTKLFLMEKFYVDEEGFTQQMQELLRQKYQVLVEWEQTLRAGGVAPRAWRSRLQALSDSLGGSVPPPAVAGWLAEAQAAYHGDSLRQARLAQRLRAFRQREQRLEEQMQDLFVGQEGITNNQQAIAETARQTRRSERAQDSIFLVMILLLISGLLLLRLIDRILANNRALYRSLEAEKARAEELARAKETFLANMSHEIRTPMFAVTGFADRLAATPLHPDQRAMLTPIRKAGGYLRDLLNEILDYSKLESGHFTLEETGFRPDRILEEVATTFRHRARDKGISLHCQGTDLPAVLIGDPMRLRQMLFNLVSNALKFTEQGGVTLTAQASPPETASDRLRLTFAVTDTGIGIAPDQIAHIFSDFIQADSSTTRKYGGTGLGLTITKRLAELQGGGIEVASQPGVGTTFTLSLPYRLGRPDDLAPEASPEWVAGQPLTGKHLLLADDEPFNQQLISGILTDWGASVTVAADGQAALDHLLAGGYDAGLLDLRMPLLDGPEVARRYRAARGSDLPLLALTATALGSELARARATGMDAHLIKPFRPIELMQVLARLLELPPPVTEVTSPEPVAAPAPGGLDLRELTQLTRGNPRHMQRLLEIFHQNMAQYLPAMQAAVTAGDATALAGVAHKMVPACRHLGLVELAAQLKTLEEDAQNNAKSDTYAPRVTAIQAQIEPILPQVAAEITRLQDRPAAE